MLGTQTAQARCSLALAGFSVNVRSRPPAVFNKCKVLYNLPMKRYNMVEAAKLLPPMIWNGSALPPSKFQVRALAFRVVEPVSVGYWQVWFYPPVNR